METLKFVMISTFYPPYHIGGDATHVYHLSNELAKLGHEVHVIHSIDSYRWQRKSEPTNVYINHKNVIVHSIESPIGRVSPLVSYILGSPFPVTKKIRKIINDVKPDVLHHHNIAGFGPFVLGIKAPKVLYTAHDYWLVCPMNGLTRYNRTFCTKKSNCFMCSIRSNRPPQLWRYSGIIEKNIENIDIIITPSNFMKEKLQEFGLQGNFVTIPNFVPEQPKIGAPLHDYPYFLFVGVLEEHKGILNLIHTFIDAKVDSKLIIVGSGSLETEIKNIIDKNNNSNKIIMLGRIDEMNLLTNIYANALASIIPSKCHENCPFSALESLANGTPIIVSDEGGLPEIIRQTNAGLIYDNKNKLGQILKNFNEMDYVPMEIINKFNKFYSSKHYIEMIFKYV